MARREMPKRAQSHAEANGLDQERGETPLLSALWDQDQVRIKELLSAGANPTEPMIQVGAEAGGLDRVIYPLDAAAQMGDLPSVLALIDAGARADALPTSHEAMMSAVSLLDVAMIKALLGAGASPNARWGNGVDALSKCMGTHHARSEREVLRIGRLLIDAGATVDVERTEKDSRSMMRPLGWAITFGSAERVKMMLDAGADSNKPGGSGLLPIELAVELGRADLLALLIDRGAKVWTNAKAEEGRKAITLLELAAQQGSEECAALLVEAGCDPTKKNVERMADLMGKASFIEAIRGPLKAIWERKALAAVKGLHAGPSKPKSRL